jgi:hypothetical protein
MQFWCKISKKFCLTKKQVFQRVQKHSQQEQRWGRSSVWLERLPVTQKAASSSLVAPAINSDAFQGVLFL